MTKNIFLGLAAGIAGGIATAVGAALGLTSFNFVWPVIVVGTLAGILVSDAKQSLTAMVDNRTRTLRKRLERLRRDTGDIHGMVRLGPYTSALPLPFGGGWALTGDSAAILAREVLVRRPSAVLELGSGVSTLIVGQILKAQGGGRLLSIDHDRRWADQTRQYVQSLGLNDVITVVEAPLRNVPVRDSNWLWYDIPAGTLDRFGLFDILIVDGPPQSSADDPRPIRYPALPLLHARLANSALIFVDDARRANESEMIERWRVEYPGWQAQRFDTVDGVCLLTPDSEIAADSQAQLENGK